MSTLAEIERKLDRSTEYELITLSGLLRKLLLDNPTLIARVNEKHRLKFRFEVTPTGGRLPLDEHVMFWAEMDRMDPHTPFARGKAEVRLDALLARNVLRVGAANYSVHDLIDYVAHIQGGVHAGTKLTPAQEALRDAQEFVRIGGFEPAHRVLCSVARVVRRGLEPLRLACSGTPK